MRPVRRAVSLGGMLLLTLLISGATLQAQATKPAITVTILAPREGQRLVGPDVTVKLQATGVEIAEANGKRTPGLAYYHLFLDRPLPQATDQPYPNGAGVFHTAKSSYTLKGLKPGRHTLIVALGDGADYPLSPPVSATVHFIVVAPPLKGAGLGGLRFSYLSALLIAAIIFILSQIIR